MPLKDLSHVQEVEEMVQKTAHFLNFNRTSLTFRSSLREEMMSPMDVIPVRSRISPSLPRFLLPLTSSQRRSQAGDVILTTLGKRKN